MSMLRIFSSNDSGVTLVEYGIAIGMAIAVGVTALTALASEIDGASIAVGTEMPD